MSVGMQLSVLCSEDAPLRHRAATSSGENAGNGVRRRTCSRIRSTACGFWPKGTVDASTTSRCASDVPALVLSGELDPVTPPTWGEAVVAHLANARHFTAPAPATA